MTLDAIKSRLASIGPTALAAMKPGARRLLEDDMPKLLAIAEEATDFLSRDSVIFQSSCHKLCKAVDALETRSSSEE